MSVQKLWYCFNPSGRTPVRGHECLGDARIEAQRLAVKEGREIYVLEMVACFHPEAVEDKVEARRLDLYDLDNPMKGAF